MKAKQTLTQSPAVKWLPGAMALAATTAGSQAAVVQITLTGNQISTLSGNYLVADLTGDGIDDITITNPRTSMNYANVKVNNNQLFAGTSVTGSSSIFTIYDAVFAVSKNVINPSVTIGQTAINLISFTDSRINSGAPTNGWLEVRAYSDNPDYFISLTRLIFDDASTTQPTYNELTYPDVQTEWSAIPEPSSFALLSLGAAGLLTRRRRHQAA